MPLSARRAAPLALSLALLGLAAAMPAHAAAPPAAPSGAPAAPARPTDTADAFWQAVAARLGVSPDALASAVRDVRTQYRGQRRRAAAAAIARALGGGITADRVQAAFERAQRAGTAPDAVLAAAARELGVAPGALRDAVRQVMAARRGVPMPAHRSLLIAGAARYLGLTAGALRAELDQGKSVAQVAQARGRSVTALEAALREAAATRIHRWVQTPWPARGGSHAPARPAV